MHELAAQAGVDSPWPHSLRELCWRAGELWRLECFKLSWLCAHQPWHTREKIRLEMFNPLLCSKPGFDIKAQEDLRREARQKLPAKLTGAQVKARWEEWQRGKK